MGKDKKNKFKTPSINLLRKKELSPIDEFIKWALTIGRLIVILTEIIALSAFLYRFSLDRQLIDLHGKIKQEERVVAMLKDNENEYRALQEKLLNISKFEAKGEDTITSLVDVFSFASSDMTINSFTLGGNSAKIEATMYSVSALSNFINALKEYPRADSVSLDRIEKKTSNGIISVSITVAFKEKNSKENINF